jgi:hypothetical protein
MRANEDSSPNRTRRPQSQTKELFKMTPPRNPRNSTSEQVDEAPGLIEREQVEVERDIPADDNDPIERIEGNKPEDPPVER